MRIAKIGPDLKLKLREQHQTPSNCSNYLVIDCYWKIYCLFSVILEDTSGILLSRGRDFSGRNLWRFGPNQVPLGLLGWFPECSTTFNCCSLGKSHRRNVKCHKWILQDEQQEETCRSCCKWLIYLRYQRNLFSKLFYHLLISILIGLLSFLLRWR